MLTAGEALPAEPTRVRDDKMLYVVATPIGNLQDLCPRAVETFRNADVIACEDTREVRKLLQPHGIEKPLVSYYRDNETARLSGLVAILKEGRNVALVCDRGTPGISDPAYLLVREAHRCGITVVPVPGPSSLTAALSVCGLPTTQVAFYGFLPRKAGKKTRFLEELRHRKETLVFFESVHRLTDTLSRMAEVFGDREATVCRELTKKFEEIRTGTLRDIAERYHRHPPKGEFVIIVKGEQ